MKERREGSTKQWELGGCLQLMHPAKPMQPGDYVVGVHWEERPLGGTFRHNRTP